MRALTAIPAPSGREELLREFLAARWGDRLCELRADRRGNLVGRIGDRGPRVGLVAHLDEIGWVVRHVTPDGFLLVDTAQGARRDGPPQRHMIGHDVVVLGRSGPAATGVFAAASGHVLTREQADRGRLDWDDFYVDLGVDTRGEVEALGIHVGSAVVFADNIRQVGSRIVGKAMDDRVGLVVMDMLLDRVDPASLGCTLVYAATVHEEGGLHGAHAVAAAVELDFAIVLEIGLVGDVPSVGASQYASGLGQGPTLVHKDGQIAYDHDLTWALADAATMVGVPFQHAVWANANTDGVPLLRAGIPTALVGIPTRYTHSPFEMIEPADVDRTVALLHALATNWPSGLTN